MRQRSRKGAPGIVEVAQKAGVSPATVSRFFNSPTMVKAGTRKKIEEAALGLGYIRDRMASALHNRFSGTVGLIVPTIDNAIFAELIHAFANRLKEYDRTMLIAAHGYDLSHEVSIMRSLLERRIDGVVVIGFEHEPAALEVLSIRNVPVLAAWNYNKNSKIDCVGADNQEAGFLVTKYLIDHGHKDIAFLFPRTENNDRASDRLNGALRAISLSFEQLPKDRFIETPYDIGEAKDAVMALLQKNRPTALVCGNDIIAQGAIYACHALGISIPDDLSIIGIGDFRGSAHIEPALTTVRLPAREIGTIAADRICHVIDSRVATNIERLNVPLRFLERGSVSTVNAS